MSNNVSLNEIMEKEPRNSISIDLTKGPIKDIPSNINDEIPQTGKAVPIHIGGTSTAGDELETLDINSILPKREKPISNLEKTLYSDLDKAVEREKRSITERTNNITLKQKEEFEVKIKEQEEKSIHEEDMFALNGTPQSSSYDMSNDRYLYEEDDIKVSENAVRITMNMDDDIEIDSTLNVSEDVETAISVSFLDEPKDSDIIYAGDVNAKLEYASYVNQNIKEEESTIFIEDNIIGAEVMTNDIKEEEIIEYNDDTVIKPVYNDIEFDEDSKLFRDDNDDDEVQEPDTNKLLEDLKTEVRTKISPIRKSFDLSKFSIAQASAGVKKMMETALKPHQHIADWVMYSAEKPISVTGLSGLEILKLNPENSNRNRLNTFKDMYQIIYKHIHDANKPDFEIWTKQVKFMDLQHIYFALYMATFGGSNFTNYSCPNKECNKVFIQDVKFEDMVKYADDETKSKVKSILAMDNTSKNTNTFKSDLIQISDNYVFAIKNPSLWNVILETASLSDAFIEKYSDLIDIVSYINNIYMIDEKHMQLVEVDVMHDKKDQALSSARRIRIFHQIISSLTSEEYYLLRSKIAEYDDRDTRLSYQLPATVCPECGEVIPANGDITPDRMLFTRHQLAAIGNM